MIPLSLLEIRDIVNGELVGIDETSAAALVLDGPVVTDSRQAAAGSLYIARIGDQADGHDFVAGAAANGALAALTTRPVEELPCVVVADDQAGFAALARAVVDRGSDLTVIGITGSSGKTSTKDLLGVVLGQSGETVAPVGSLNSEVGVPLTVTRITADTRYLVVEMGARGIGHIQYLTEIAPPQIGIVLNVGTAHVGEFGSREAIAIAKSELPQAIPANGVAILNSDDAAVRAMADQTQARIVLVGEADEATVRATDVRVDAQGRARFTAHTPHGSVPMALTLVGRHHVANALAVLATALEVNMPLEQAAAAIGAAGPISRWRMEVTDRPDGVTVVNDAYNANPESMRAALVALEAMGQERRTWAVLGTMLELGDESEADHADVGAEAARRGVDELIVVGAAEPMVAGARAEASASGARINVRHVPDAAAAEALLHKELRPGDVVVFKSSRDAGLRWLGDRISGREETPA